MQGSGDDTKSTMHYCLVRVCMYGDLDIKVC